MMTNKMSCGDVLVRYTDGSVWQNHLLSWRGLSVSGWPMRISGMSAGRKEHLGREGSQGHRHGGRCMQNRCVHVCISIS